MVYDLSITFFAIREPRKAGPDFFWPCVPGRKNKHYNVCFRVISGGINIVLSSKLELIANAAFLGHTEANKHQMGVAFVSRTWYKTEDGPRRG